MLDKISLLTFCNLAVFALLCSSDPNFTILYLVIRQQFLKEQKKFIVKFGLLNSEKAETAKLQKINKEILSNISTN